MKEWILNKLRNKENKKLVANANGSFITHLYLHGRRVYTHESSGLKMENSGDIYQILCLWIVQQYNYKGDS